MWMLVLISVAINDLLFVQAKFRTFRSGRLDIDQEMLFARILLNVSGVIPSIEAR